MNFEPFSLGSRVYIPSTFVAIKTFDFNKFAIYTAIESEVTSQEYSKGFSFLKYLIQLK